MLDNVDYIAQIDTGNGLAMVAGQTEQLSQEFTVDVSTLSDVQSVVLAGMGGSALAGDFVNCWHGNDLSVPLVVHRDYQLPGFVNQHTLVIVSSYSGNTEETLSALTDAEAKGAQIIVVASGGQLHEIAQQKDYPLLQIPDGLQPRLAVLYGVRALATLFEKLELASGWTSDLAQAGTWAANQVTAWSTSIPTTANPAKQLAGKLVGKAGVIYAGPTLEFAAKKWKINLNENAKNLAFSYAWPEFSHNEFQGWSHPTGAPLAVIELQSNLDNSQIAKRFEISNKLLSGTMPAPTMVQAAGDTALQQLIWTVLLGDFISVYVAILNGVNPLPVALVEKLKQELAG